MSRELSREEAEKCGVIEKIPDEENMYYLNGLPTEINPEDKVDLSLDKTVKVDQLKSELNDLMFSDNPKYRRIKCYKEYQTGWNDAINAILESFDEPDKPDISNFIEEAQNG